MKRLLSYNPLSGVSCYFEQDIVTGEITLSHEYADVSRNLDFNRTERNDFDRAKQNESWWKVASIPTSIMNKWLVEDGIDVLNKNHWDRVKRKLNDPDWAYLRTSPGKV